MVSGGEVLPQEKATPAPQEFDPDERRTCRECSRFDHYRRWCLNPRNAGLNGPAIAAAIAHLPQRCPGFAENPNREEPEHD